MLKKLKIAPKLLIAFILVAVISSLSGIVSLFLLKSADSSYSYALVNYGFSQGDIGLLMSKINANATEIMNAIASTDPAAVNEALSRTQENITVIDKYVESVGKTAITDQEKTYYKQITDNLPLFSEQAQKVLELAKQNKNEEAIALYESQAKPYLDKVEAGVESLMNLNIDTGTKLSDSLTTSSNVTLVAMLIFIIVALGVSILLAVIIARSIARPMQLCSERIVKLSNGDLRSPVPQVNTQDETGVLSRATGQLVGKLDSLIHEMTTVLEEMSNGNFNVTHDSIYGGDFAPLHTSTVKIIGSLNDTLKRINISSDQVASGADQVSSAAQSLSQGATEQASSVQELAATITEISGQIKDTSQNAQAANERTSLMEDELAASNKKMQEMIDAMSNISDSSNQIGKIIKTIEDIAFQTNILALNAAVEAARAGAAGKGFAVVADEVRNLASKSAEASQSTSGLIESSIHAVENGTRIADETAKALLSAVDGAREVSTTVDKISRASATQAEAIAQVTTGIDQISAVVQTNSATAEESAAASEELSGQAQVMKSLVAKFRLNGTAAAPSHTDYTEQPALTQYSNASFELANY